MKIKIGQRLVSAVLAVGMITSVLPIPAFAETGNSQRTLLSTLEQENDTGVTDDIIEIKVGSGSSFGEAPATDNMNTELWSYETNLLGVKTLTLKKGRFKLIGGALQDEINLSIESGATFVDGKVNGKVSNAGTIEGGTFSHALPHTGMNVGPNGSKTQWVGGNVGNSGTITGGTFKGQLWNTGTISGGTIYGEVYNSGEITGTAEFAITSDDYGNRGGNPSKYGVITNRENGIISGGSFGKSCRVKNQGTISGGVFATGQGIYQVDNSGGKITGGQFMNCEVLNGVLNYVQGTISGGTFDNNYTVSNNGGFISGGTFRKGTVVNTSAGTKVGQINGGIFTGTVTGDKSSQIDDGVFTGDVTGPTIYGGIFKNEPDVYDLSAAVRYADGTTTFSLLKNGTADVSGVLENVTVLYVASKTLAKEITIVPSTDVIDVSGNIKYNGKAGKPLLLRMEMRGNNGDLVLNSITYTLTVNGKGEQKAYNEDVEVTAEEKTGETFTGWTVEGVEVADKSSKKLNFKMPANNVTLTANYSTNGYTLTVKNGSPESVTDEVGTEVTLTANEPDGGMTFDRWKLSDDTILVSGELTDQVITVKIPEGGATAEAIYKNLPVAEDTYNLTVVNCKAYKADDLHTVLPENAKLEEGTLVVVTFTDTPEDVFDKWIIESSVELKPLEETDEEGAHSIKIMMPACEVVITATTNPVVPEQPDNPSGGGGVGGAVAVVGGVVIAGVAIGAGIVAANHYIATNLPQGFDLPTTRQQLAVVLWNMAGKPEVTPAENYTDVEDVKAQKAVHWVVEKQLMEPESENVFGAQKSVSKLKTLQLMIKTNNLMRAEVQ